MSSDISLRALLDLSIGTPDAGAVDFSALRTLLHAILGHLKIERVTAAWKESDSARDSPSQTKALLPDGSSPYSASYLGHPVLAGLRLSAELHICSSIRRSFSSSAL